MRGLEKVPVPAPSVVHGVVGLANVDQQMPWAVTEAPPLAVTSPPVMIAEPVIAVTVVVETVGLRTVSSSTAMLLASEGSAAAEEIVAVLLSLSVADAAMVQIRID